MNTIKVKTTNHVTIVSLNRPEVHNAFNEDLMKELYQAFKDLENDNETRAVVLTAMGKSFCAGGDLNYMKSAREKSHEQNIDESLYMAQMFESIDQLSKPVICVVNGATFGGGVGLVSACDIVIAHESAFFSLSEVRLGLNPSVISPFVIRKIGEKYARRYFLTGEKIDSLTAQEIGLVHEVVTLEEQDKVLGYILNQIMNNGPKAMAAAKQLIRKNSELQGEKLKLYTAEQISDLRVSEEAQEGMSAFFEKRKAKYVIEY